MKSWKVFYMEKTEGCHLQENHIEAFLRSLHEPAFIADGSGTIVFWNRELEKLLGYSESARENSELIESLDAIIPYFRAALDDMVPNPVAETVKHRDGTMIDIELSLSVSVIEKSSCLIGMLRDVRDFNNKISELETALQDYMELAENSPIGIISCDSNGTITFVNNMVIKMLGSPNREETQKINLLTFPLLVESGFSDKLRQCIQTKTHIKYELNYVSKWGKQIWLSIHNKPQMNGKDAGAQIIIDDITERKKLEQELIVLSFTDTLTGVYNRRYFILELEENIKDIQQTVGNFAVIMVDLDHFKKINDRFGHAFGDFILKEVTSELKKGIRKEDVLARWGGEEFILLLTGATLSDAQKIAEKLRSGLENIKIPNFEGVTGSFGVAAYCAGDSLDNIIQRADNMLYDAKLSGRNCVR